jgi:hypothetical protein
MASSHLSAQSRSHVSNVLQHVLKVYLKSLKLPLQIKVIIVSERAYKETVSQCRENMYPAGSVWELCLTSNHLHPDSSLLSREDGMG